MPAPGEQHLNNGSIAISNPFEETKPRVSEYTAQEIATLQSRLEKRLGPEYISSRAGPSGQKVHYIAAEKCIQLANEVFGFNGWSSSIMNLQVDFVDENPTTLKVSLGLSVIVRVTLRDGTFHEDIGYGHIENCKGKAAAFEKAKKEGTTDALKRALRNFGNVLGNCIYDKDYLTKVTKVKVRPATKWDVEGLHRHSDYAPAKKESEPAQDITQEVGSAEGSTLANGDFIDSMDDEFGDFDEADFSVPNGPDAHPDEVQLPAIPHQVGGDQVQKTVPSIPNAKASPPLPRIQGTSRMIDANPNKPGGPAPQLQPHTPNSAFSRSTSLSSALTQKRPQDVSIAPRPRQVNGGTTRILHQPSRTGSPSAPGSPNPHLKSTIDVSNPEALAPLPGPLSGGFYSARAVQVLPETADQNASKAPQPPANLPAFNVHAESPSIRKTPGVDHNRSKPLTKDLKHVPGSTQQNAGPHPGQIRTNILNPQLESTRRIGVPGIASPTANRGMYKPPTIKRPSEGGNAVARAPLGDLSANGNQPVTDAGGDAKRQKLNT